MKTFLEDEWNEDAFKWAFKMISPNQISFNQLKSVFNDVHIEVTPS